MSAPRGAFSCSGNRSRRPARRSAPAARGTRRPSRPRTCIGIKAAFRQRSTRVEELSSHSILSKIDGDAATTLEKSSTCHTAPTCSRPRRAATRTRRSPPSNGRRRRGGTSSSWAASSRSNSCRAPGRTRLVGPWAAGRHSGRPSRHSADTRRPPRPGRPAADPWAPAGDPRRASTRAVLSGERRFDTRREAGRVSTDLAQSCTRCVLLAPSRRMKRKCRHKVSSLVVSTQLRYQRGHVEAPDQHAPVAARRPPVPQPAHGDVHGRRLGRAGPVQGLGPLYPCSRGVALVPTKGYGNRASLYSLTILSGASALLRLLYRT